MFTHISIDLIKKNLFIMFITVVIRKIVLFLELPVVIWCFLKREIWLLSVFHVGFVKMSRLHWSELQPRCGSASPLSAGWSPNPPGAGLCRTEPQLDPAELKRANGDEAHTQKKVFLCKLRWSSTLPALFHQFGFLI